MHCASNRNGPWYVPAFAIAGLAANTIAAAAIDVAMDLVEITFRAVAILNHPPSFCLSVCTLPETMHYVPVTTRNGY